MAKGFVTKSLPPARISPHRLSHRHRVINRCGPRSSGGAAEELFAVHIREADVAIKAHTGGHRRRSAAPTLRSPQATLKPLQGERWTRDSP